MSALSHLAPGAVFARDYRIVGLLAEGGMGAVYIAEQLSTGKRRALKVMLADLVSDPRARQRFELEARIAAQIESEHVVEVVGAGVDEASRTPWLAMELLEGQDLSKVIRERGPMPAEEVLVCFQQLGHALGIAHAKGIVHRDLKPENLYLAASRRMGGGTGPFTLKVLDFGIAKLTQESRATSNRTAAMGSPLWMAPEQTEQSTLTPATDVWALGLIGFFLLTGKLYWRSANQEETRLATVLTELLVSPLDPASVRAAQLGRHEPLPPGFDQWFFRCVARDRSQRFPDAHTAVAALGARMSYRDLSSREASQPFVHPGSQPGQMQGVAPTVPLAAYPSVPPVASHPPYGSQPGVVSPYGSAPGMVAPSGGPGSAPGVVSPYASAPGMHVGGSQPGVVAYAGPIGSGAVALPASSGFTLGRLLAYTSAFVAALACTGGVTFGALHAWQTYGPSGASPTPPPPFLLTTVPDSGVSTSIGVIAAAPDAGAPMPLDAGRPDTGTAVVAPRDPPRRPRAHDTETPPETGSEFAWSDGAVHVFRGNGHFANGIVADFTLTLNRNGGTLDGLFHWVVSEVPESSGSTAHVGNVIDEAVTGTWSAPSCSLHTVGSASGTTMNLRIDGEGRISGRDGDGTRYSGRMSR
jgi:serine/threonine protein kinase